MKKILYAIIFLFVSLSATAENYFTTGYSDTLLINPILLNNGYGFWVRAHFDGRVDRWTMDITYPTGCDPTSVLKGDDMKYMPYYNSDGVACTYEAPLTYNSNYSTFSSIITEFGYWDPNNDGIFEPYGTIKWEAGYHDVMFRITISLDVDCTGDSITFNGYVEGTYDWRGGTTNGRFYKKVILKVGYQIGDVNGDGSVNINDVTTLQSYLANQEVLDQYQLDAADVNRSGTVTLNDLTELINMLLSANGLEGGDLSDLQAIFFTD